MINETSRAIHAGRLPECNKSENSALDFMLLHLYQRIQNDINLLGDFLCRHTRAPERSCMIICNICINAAHYEFVEPARLIVESGRL